MFSTTVMVAEKIKIPSEVTLFKNVNIFDGKTDKLQKRLDVLVVKNKIHKIGKNIPTPGTWKVEVNTGGVKLLLDPVGGMEAYMFKSR